MPNINYVAQGLDGEQIEAALTAINGVVLQENNGKVLAVENGKIVAKSASEWTDAPVLEPVTITKNGTTTPPSGVDGFNSVTVAVHGAGNIQPLSVTENGTYSPPSGVDGFAPVTVNVQGTTVVPINILHPKSYSGSAYNSPDPNVSISRASDDAATVTFNGTKVADVTINYQLQIPDNVIKTFVGCKVRAVSNDSRVNMHIQKRTSPWTYYGSALHGEFTTIPNISESDIVFCIDIEEAGGYNNVTSYLEVFGIE